MNEQVLHDGQEQAGERREGSSGQRGQCDKSRHKSVVFGAYVFRDGAASLLGRQGIVLEAMISGRGALKLRHLGCGVD